MSKAIEDDERRRRSLEAGREMVGFFFLRLIISLMILSLK